VGSASVWQPSSAPISATQRSAAGFKLCRRVWLDRNRQGRRRRADCQTSC